METRIYVLRHGKAEADAPTGRDADRALEPRGHAQAAWIAARLAELEPVPACILTSPVRRARETCAHLEAALGVHAAVEPRLSTDRSVSQVLDAVRDALSAGPQSSRRSGVSVQGTSAQTQGPVVIVGHNPHFEGFASAMLGERAVSMRTGEMIGLAFNGEVEPGTAQLLGVWRFDGSSPC